MSTVPFVPRRCAPADFCEHCGNLETLNRVCYCAYCWGRVQSDIAEEERRQKALERRRQEAKA
ncbi:MAG: hypothetical protein U1F68_14955 [Gammaproteobacteria bacterium]